MEQGEFTENKKIPEPYAISQTRFEIEPRELKPYKPGDKITRENFCNFLIYSFAISRGQAEVQIDFMRWLKAHTGFDYAKTLYNFGEAGGWNRLSDSEKKEFKKQFNEISKHSKGSEEERIETEIEAVKQTARETDSSIGYKDKERIEEMKTFPEFLVFARDKITKLREEQRKLNEQIRS